MYKLAKSLSDQGPRSVADRKKGQIDKFKQHLPLLHCICNPGIRDRHWEQVRHGYCRHLFMAITLQDYFFNMELIDERL